MLPVGQFHIREAGPADIPEVRRMVQEYVSWIGLDLAFQEIDAELAGLPGDYAPPRGALFVADDRARLIGMIGLRPFDEAICEMKRLYVRPGFRRVGLGRTLAKALLDEARRAGYSTVLLDTLDDMEAARELYATLGFVEIPPYYYNPIAGAHYLKAELK